MNNAYRELLAFESALNEFQPESFEWPGELGFEAAGQRRRKSPGTDCGRPGAPAALVSQPGGRCIGPTPPVCPSVTGIITVHGIGNVPFEYVEGVARDPATNLVRVTKRQRPRRQKFLPIVQTVLSQFIANMQRFGMPIEAILTAGTFCCRCIKRTNSLSNHSHGDAIDLVGVRWAGAGGRETIMHNWNTPERALLRRLNACLRLSFANVIDYYNADHRDHFHCDMNGARARSAQDRNPRGRSTVRFTQEALTVVLGRPIPVTGRIDAATRRALMEFGQVNEQALRNTSQLNGILDQLFTRVAQTGPGVGAQPGAGGLTQELQQPAPGRSPRPPAAASLPGTTFYESIPLGGEGNARPQTGIFIPAGYRPQPQIDLIFYFHGMKAPSGFPTSATIANIWTRHPFRLREAVNDSGKNVILVAPTLGPASQAGRLLNPGGFDWYVDQVMGALVRRGIFQRSSQPPQVGNILLSCHSAGGRVMRPLALRSHRYSGRVRQCWGFDCLYHPCDAEIWRQWAIGHPNVALYVYYLGSTAVHSRDLQGAGTPPVPAPANVRVQRSSAPNHNHVPLAHLKNLIQQATFLQNK